MQSTRDFVVLSTRDFVVLSTRDEGGHTSRCVTVDAGASAFDAAWQCVRGSRYSLGVDWAAFWRMVDEARAEMGSDSELVARALLRRLRALTPGDIKQFQELWEQARDEVYRWPIDDAATLMLGPLDGDAFFAVQDWILSHGRQTMRQVRADPDNLVALASDRHNARIDWFAGLALEAHLAATGTSFTVDGPLGLEEPIGVPVDLTDEASARRQFPRLAAYLDDNPWISRPWERPTD